MSKQKLELTWIGKDKRPKLEPRILLEDPEKSYHAKFRSPPRPLGDEPDLKPLRAMGQADCRADRPTMYYPMIAPDGTAIYPRKQDGTDGRWRWGPEKVNQEKSRIDWVKGRNDWTPYFRVYADIQTGRPPETIWNHSDVGSNRTSKAEAKALFPDQTAFGTPKPEALLQRVIAIATNPGDLVLDSFAGSGTTGAVAHKMGRRWIMIELGEHCHTHIIPRLKKVIDGEDQGGISKAANWQGGGGFRYFKLAPTLIVNDKWGNPIINPDYNPAMLAEALAKLEGFTYAPSEVHWWQHGHSSERDFIYVTTQNLSANQLQALADDVGDERSLLVMCSAFHGIPCAQAVERWPNLTIKKIPQAVLSRCEWGHDDYSLNVANLPMAEPEAKAPVPQPSPRARERRPASGTPDLFGDGEGEP